MNYSDLREAAAATVILSYWVECTITIFNVN